MCISAGRLGFQPAITCLAVGIGGTLSWRHHAGLGGGVVVRGALVRLLVGAGWGTGPSTLHASALALVCAPAECCTPAWSVSGHAGLLDVSLSCALRAIAGCLRPAPVERLPVLVGISSAELRRAVARGETRPGLGSLRPFAPCQLPCPMR